MTNLVCLLHFQATIDVERSIQIVVPCIRLNHPPQKPDLSAFVGLNGISPPSNYFIRKGSITRRIARV